MSATRCGPDPPRPIRGTPMLSRCNAQNAIGGVRAAIRPNTGSPTGVGLDGQAPQAGQSNASQGAIDQERSADGRRAPRRSSVLGGTITATSMTSDRPCKVVDMSATGARVRLMPAADLSRGLPASVPDAFTLILRIDRVEVDCEVMWRTNLDIGVRFLGASRPLRRAR